MKLAKQLFWIAFVAVLGTVEIIVLFAASSK
jgi:hypothetical protein